MLCVNKCRIFQELIHTHQYNAIVVSAQLHALTHNDNFLKRVLNLFQ